MNLSKIDQMLQALALLDKASRAKTGYYLQCEEAEALRWLLDSLQVETAKKSEQIMRLRTLLQRTRVYLRRSNESTGEGLTTGLITEGLAEEIDTELTRKSET